MDVKLLNTLGKNREPFLFISDFKGEDTKVLLLKELEHEDIEFSINENFRYEKHHHFFKASAIDFSDYSLKFNKIIEKIKEGKTYVINLTQATPVETSLSLKEIFRHANAHYKLRYKDKFVCFSPEKFIQISDNKIHTFPMKGTIDSAIPNAKAKILSDEKEKAEHIMIVDLLRNDLSIVSKNVKVEKFRYLSEVNTGSKKLLQVSSKISGELSENWHENIGTILEALLPAGSISGAPKKSTLEIIEEVEAYERGYFTGVFGVFDGEIFDSGVMIRFIEKTDRGFVYKSGGGITLDSDVSLEYNELQNKIYLP
ncbi:aminodeoxychorismate synthase component I [Sulfurimonas sp. SAG-AH-194-L11]|nr:aminodeoxychorismate synthase component I [Sulfurimonas sp. SAG-AH-194-L11]MDF1876485.1 aminodeoxychorismate synthase component I [Sulfurimonas sp. SAG-AH-194-L11]